MTTPFPSRQRTAPSTTRPRYPLAPARKLTVETVASRGGLHPDLVHRFVALGLLEASRDAELVVSCQAADARHGLAA
ncbi:hypothetical protein CcI156_20500 [Frankia sp. CcI156]|nr:MULTISPECIES: hypothetical protein [Frankia]ETA00897.1 hypothetical protein CcI6DRAFT_03659 [Frankia sp. CcI6]EYT90717.1 hypothetical protein ThrDRAFT_03653 [Frankia casuarinae]KDA41466.1 hypothetical protein BMG523Draft_03725 [Frankia sp. BMG5.23]KEZ35006.1 hypothetical protein CEDDRAFT_03619 [Frankia sp. CeD]KFB02987.1 hypothetical protein ALLO2DRAFT_04258 [Frankia sp. Allo2]